MENQKRCPECKFSQGHSYDCPNLTIDDARTMVKKYSKELEEASARYNKWVKHMVEQVNSAKYKYMTVKHENNQLRKKLYPGK